MTTPSPRGPAPIGWLVLGGGVVVVVVAVLRDLDPKLLVPGLACVPLGLLLARRRPDAPTPDREPLPAVPATPVQTPPVPAARSEPPPSAAPAFDRALALERCADDEALLLHLIETLPAEAREQTTALADALAAADARQVRHHAHRLKGSLQYIAAEPAEAAATAIERSAVAGDLAAAADTFVLLRAELERLYQALAAAR